MGRPLYFAAVVTFFFFFLFLSLLFLLLLLLPSPPPSFFSFLLLLLPLPLSPPSARGSLEIQDAENYSKKDVYRESEKMLNSNISSRCPYNMVKFNPLTADIRPHSVTSPVATDVSGRDGVINSS